MVLENPKAFQEGQPGNSEFAKDEKYIAWCVDSYPKALVPANVQNLKKNEASPRRLVHLFTHTTRTSFKATASDGSA